jgi:histidyl-tRNA synthetase
MRGFKDNLPPISYAIEHVRKVFAKYSMLYGCNMIDLPLVEEADLYFRTSGDASDICNKELFEVRKYKGDFKNWVLRPEGTASCMRAIHEANLMQDAKLLKFAYFDHMFRYNRPQHGRYRQFLNAGWEFVGIEGAEIDCELILGAKQFLDEFNLEYALEINSIGSCEDRKTYRNILAKHFKLEFSYEHDVREVENYLWLPVYGDDLSRVREEVGLSREPIKPFHMTVGRT